MSNNIFDRLELTFDVSNVMIHRPNTAGLMGQSVVFGEINSSSNLKATGWELLESIRVAQKHVDRVNEAIANMQHILLTAEPIVKGESE